MENSPIENSPSKHFSWSVGEICAICAPAVVFLHCQFIRDHFVRWSKPKEQRPMVFLLVIPPIQAVISYIQYFFPDFNDTLLFTILDSIKQCYTSLIFPLFLSLLYTYLKLNDDTLSSIYVRVIIGNRHITNFFPVTLIQPERVSITLDNLKFFEYSAWQFVVIHVVYSVLMILFQLLGMYPVWLSCVFLVILNLSFLLALYTVYVFFQAFSEDFRLRQHRVYVFFRLIVFTCFFQGAVIRIVKETGIIQANLQNILVIAEMSLFITPSKLAFTATEYARIRRLPVVQPVTDESTEYLDAVDVLRVWIMVLVDVLYLYYSRIKILFRSCD